jgi:hypothetical protein
VSQNGIEILDLRCLLLECALGSAHKGSWLMVARHETLSAQRRKINLSTSAITLLLVGAVVVGCDSEEQHRAFYSSKEACLKDWGTEASCQQSHGSNGTVYYFGPWYSRSSSFWGRGGGGSAGIVSQGGSAVSSGTEAARFGGFGGSASSHGGAGE